MIRQQVLKSFFWNGSPPLVLAVWDGLEALGLALVELRAYNRRSFICKCMVGSL